MRLTTKVNTNEYNYKHSNIRSVYSLNSLRFNLVSINDVNNTNQQQPSQQLAGFFTFGQ